MLYLCGYGRVPGDSLAAWQQSVAGASPGTCSSRLVHAGGNRITPGWHVSSPTSF